ncbi:MAG: hypothetical protein ACD_46C00260G0003 [uncultured bacterium]|nr:MAG: hypothetical protein ACD_46C00260G0003 [uncultured bacterium]
MHRWQPAAPIENLKIRARILQRLREFFAKKNILEVETPLLCHTSVTDPYIESIPAMFQSNALKQTYYLQTSPEYAMKRLLAADSGPIFQICKAFRQGEIGQQHNPEFTILEWYRPGFDHHQLMNEMDELLQFILQALPAERKTYAEVFQLFLQIDPHTASTDTLKRLAHKHDINVQDDISDRDTWLQILMSYCIEPQIGRDRPFFIYNFPISQAALAKIVPGNPATASRFEVYFKGFELANGFHELTDAKEQRKRFENNLQQRKILNLADLPIDEFFLQALVHGLPNCAGVALGVDRLVMIATKSSRIKNVLSFDFPRA